MQLLQIFEKFTKKLYKEQISYMNDPFFKSQAQLWPTSESPVEGFDLLIQHWHDGVDVHQGIKFPFKELPKAIFVLPRAGRRIYKAISKSFCDLKKNSTINPVDKNQTTSLPHSELWSKLKDYVENKWGKIILGFTEVPPQMVFQDRMVLYRYAIVVIQEMRKEFMDHAPKIKAGKEVIRVYASLGEIVNDIAEFLRINGVMCQANHPLRGLVINPPLAGKAGLGGQGQQGLLITPEFGVRQRIAPVFIEAPIFEFTDNHDHQWIEQYCATCGICVEKCPAGAIRTERITHVDNVPGIGQIRTCVDIKKCFPYFASTFGCSVCLKVCPFSAGEGAYFHLKTKFFEKKII